MTKSKLSLPLALLMLFVLACTCGNMDKNSNNSNNSNSSNSSGSNNENGRNNNSSSNKNTSTTSSSAATGIPECDAYIKAIDEYLNCPNVPESNREEYRKKRAEMIEQIKQAGQNDYGKKIMATVCQQAADAINQEVEKCK